MVFSLPLFTLLQSPLAERSKVLRGSFFGKGGLIGRSSLISVVTVDEVKDDIVESALNEVFGLIHAVESVVIEVVLLNERPMSCLRNKGFLSFAVGTG